jgi:hypothetical protein
MRTKLNRKGVACYAPILTAAAFALAIIFIFSCSGGDDGGSNDGGGDNTGESKYNYCITADNICLTGPFIASTCTGQPSNDCPYAGYSSSLDGSSSGVPSSSSIDDDSSSSSGGGTLINLEEALRAKPIAASNYGEPEILDSWTKGDRNYYIIYAGEIRNTFVSEIAYVHYIGFPIGFSKTTVTEKAVTNSMTQTVSNSIVFSNTSQTKSTLDAAIKAKIKIVDFSVGLKLEESITNSVSNTKSTETSISSVTSTVETNASTISFEIGKSGEPVGHYRYSLYDVSDVYFVISTSLDNSTLLSWDVISCARGSYLQHWEYSPSGNFDNSPIAGSEIVFAEDFYKTLKKPTADKTVERNVVEFTVAGIHTYTFNKGYPATVEIYALGAGGGGQGGNSRTGTLLPSNYYYGTGGAGGGGAAVYAKINVNATTTFSINVGKGGDAGGVRRITNGDAGKTGYSGGNGDNSSVNWGGFTLIAQGGNGGNQPDNNDRNTAGGAGGSTDNVTYPEGNLDKAAAKGYAGSSGVLDGLSGSTGGPAASINKGSLDSFGGGLGAVRCPSCWYTGEFLISDSGSRETESGGGGAGGYGEVGSSAKSWSNNGSPGGNGKVIIVVTEL